jgi:hypothetical protein
MLVHRTFRSLVFFKKTDSLLLRDYFVKRCKIFDDFPWDKFNPKELFNKYALLPEPDSQKYSEELGAINDLSVSNAMPTLIKKAGELGIDYKDKTAYDLSLALFLKSQSEFEKTHEFFYLEQMPGYSDYRGKEPKEPKTFDKIKTVCEKTLAEKFKEQNRGEMVIEHYEEKNKQAYVIYYEDHKKPKPEIKGGVIIYKKERPVYEAALIYYPPEGRLKIKARKSKIRDLCVRTFAKEVLDDEDFFNHPDATKVYDLDKFKGLPLKYPTDPVHEIENIKEVAIKAAFPGSDETIELHSEDDLKGLLKKHNVNLNQMEILKIGIKIKFPGAGRRGSKTVWLSQSNHSNISDSPVDRIIDDYLKQWDIANR